MISATIFQSILSSALAPLQPYLADDTVSEIAINGPTQIFIERQGRLERTEARFQSADSLLSALRVVAQYVGRTIDEHHPILEARLPDGSRLEAILAPVAQDGPAVSIRRFSKERLNLQKLLSHGALTHDAALLLKVLIECKQNIVIAGGTGSGKTSLLNALSALIPDCERVVVIEDSRELQLQREHVVQLEAQPPDSRGRGEISIRDLFRASLRMRPDRIVLGEIRGGEALDLVQAMTSGHGGCLTTIHASYPIDTLNRLETLALMGGVELPLYALRSQLASAVDIIVQTARMRDGRRRVTHISEVLRTDDNSGYRVIDLFCSHARRLNSEGSITLELVPTGSLPSCMDMLLAHGLTIPGSMQQAAARKNAARGGRLQC